MLKGVAEMACAVGITSIIVWNIDLGLLGSMMMGGLIGVVCGVVFSALEEWSK